ncbi:serine hydrolase [Pontibacter harenae]|uniref:serine hydrolase n=1 Tax=Pontibacter harenae TaxID=2894083 RepID=UPI001E4E90A4|nr:serine hydrolase [Pontibacter harenae]MCC9165821.1 serine hydrolase [Pontibacter harenae]
MRRIFLTLVLIAVFATSHAQPLSSKKIDLLVERSMKAFDVPGIALAVIKDGKVIHSKGYGVRSLETKEKVNEHTLFGIASNTKAFTTAALAILVDEEKLEWDDKVRDYIPELKLYNPYVTEEFTVRDLLTHRSGMGLGAGDLMFYPDSSDFTVNDVIYNLRFLKPVSGFRSKYDYDNTLYVIAGEVITRASGQSWDSFVEERILKPLGMNRSAAAFNRLKDKSNVSDPHAVVDGKLQKVSRHSSGYSRASGSMYSSVADLSKWVILQLTHGKYGEGQTKTLFSEEVHEEMWSPQTIIPVRSAGAYNTHFSAYGLGFNISDVNGYKQINHTGGTVGMVTQITMIPELNLGIIVLTNQQEGGAFRSIADQIKDGYFNMSGTDRVTQYATARKQQLEQANKLTESVWKEIAAVQKANNTQTELAVYTGVYHDAWFGDVEISAKNGKLWFESKRSPKLSGELFPYKGNSFVVKWLNRTMDADAFVNFSLDTEGKAAGITMKAVSPLTDFSYDFHDLEFSRLK